MTHGRAAAPRHRECVSGTLCAKCPTRQSAAGHGANTANERTPGSTQPRIALEDGNIHTERLCSSLMRPEKERKTGKLTFASVWSGLRSVAFELNFGAVLGAGVPSGRARGLAPCRNLNMSFRNLMLLPNLTVWCFEV